MHGGVRDASQQYGPHTRQASGAQHEGLCVVAVGDLDDRLPDRTGGLDRERLGLQARVAGDAYALGGDMAAVLGGRAVDCEEIGHGVGRARPCQSFQGQRSAAKP